MTTRTVFGLAIMVLVAGPAAAQLGGSSSSGSTGASSSAPANPASAPLTPGAPTTLPSAGAPGAAPLLHPDAANSPLTPGLSPQQTLTPRRDPVAVMPELRQQVGAPASTARASATRAARCRQVLKDPSAFSAADVEGCRSTGDADARFNQLEEANRRAVRSICSRCLD